MCVQLQNIRMEAFERLPPCATASSTDRQHMNSCDRPVSAHQPASRHPCTPTQWISAYTFTQCELFLAGCIQQDLTRAAGRKGVFVVVMYHITHE